MITNASICTGEFIVGLEDIVADIRILYLRVIHTSKNKEKTTPLKGGDRRVRRFSAHNNWWATLEVSLLLLYERSAKVFLNFLRQGVKTMYYFKNMHSKSLKCAK